MCPRLSAGLQAANMDAQKLDSGSKDWGKQTSLFKW